MLLANILAWTITCIIMDYWLQGFAYYIDMQPWVFIQAGVVALISALLTIFHQAFKAAHTNPVEPLQI